MTETYLQLAKELDAYTAGVLPPLGRTSPPTGEEIKRSVSELVTHIDHTLVSIAGRIRALDEALKETQLKQTGSEEPLPPRTPKEVLDDLKLSVNSPAPRNRFSWSSVGKRLKRLIKRVNDEQEHNEQEEDRRQRYREQREQEGKDLWSCRPPGPTPRPKRRRSHAPPKVNLKEPSKVPEGIGPVINLAEESCAQAASSPRCAPGILPGSSKDVPNNSANSIEPHDQQLLTSEDMGQRPGAHSKGSADALDGCSKEAAPAHEKGWRPETTSGHPYVVTLEYGEKIRRQSLVRTRGNAPLDSARQTLDSQEAFGVVLVVAAATFHRGDSFVVQAGLARTAVDDDVPLVQLEGHFAGALLHRVLDESEQGIELGVVPEAVVNVFGDNRLQLVT